MEGGENHEVNIPRWGQKLAVLQLHYGATLQSAVVATWKLLTNSYYADVASRGSLELGSECCNQGQIIFTWFSTWQSRSVSLCGIPLCGWAVVAPRCFHFTITALTVDRGSSSRAEIIRTDLLERWQPMTVPCWKSKLFSKAILLPMFVYGDCMAVWSILHTGQQRVWLK